MVDFSDGMYIDPAKVFSYGRRWIFINSKRGTGKTYSFQKYMLHDCIKRGVQILQIYRTQRDQESDACQTYAKVLMNEFPAYQSRITAQGIDLNLGDDETPRWQTVVQAVAMSAFQRVKKRSFPLIKYMLFDEYIIESLSDARYIKGNKEPDILLNLYDTVDRRENRVFVVCLGNTASFYNPYHMHPAFHIMRDPGEGNIYKTEFVLFINYKPPRDWATKQDSNPFVRMISGTSYGDYAADGKYIEDSSDFIESRPERCKPCYNLACGSAVYGVWDDTNLYYISDKYDPGVTTISCDQAAHTEANVYRDTTLRDLGMMWAYGFIRFDNPRIKAAMMPVLYDLKGRR